MRFNAPSFFLYFFFVIKKYCFYYIKGHKLTNLMTNMKSSYRIHDQMNLCCCSAAVTFYFLCVFVNCFVACIAMVSR